LAIFTRQCPKIMQNTTSTTYAKILIEFSIKRKKRKKAKKKKKTKKEKKEKKRKKKKKNANGFKGLEKTFTNNGV